MPYNIKPENGKYCVYNKVTGKKKGCSDTKPEAVAYMRKLYSVEDKERTSDELDALVVKALNEMIDEYPDEKDKLDQMDTKEYLESINSYWTPAKSYQELEQVQEAAEKAMKIDNLLADFPWLAQNIISSPDVVDKAAAVENLGRELALKIRNIESDDDKEIDDKAKRSDVSEADRERAVSEYGNVTYADPENKKYPIDSEKHIRAAWSYINMSKNAAKYDSSKVASIKNKIVSAWKKKIDPAGPPKGDKKEIEYMLDYAWYSTMANIEDFFTKDTVEDESGLFVWKESDGSHRWLTKYSNNFRDQDNPPEIITADSHRRFVELVDKGEAPYPELWLWHVKEWKCGQATWVAYDDHKEAGYALASGYFDKGCEPIAEWLESVSDEFRVSHGMPNESIIRDKEDNSLILEHVTIEISPLPAQNAANPLTGFIIKEVDDMAIPTEKRRTLIEKYGLPENLLDSLEERNRQEAEKAISDGVQTKETEDIETNTDETVEEEVNEETEIQDTDTDSVNVSNEQNADEQTEEEKEKSDPLKEYPTRGEIAEAFAAVINPLVEKINGFEAEIKDLRKSKEDSLEDIIKNTPSASLASLLVGRVIGNEEAEISKEDKLANRKPAEKEVSSFTTGVPFIDQMLSGNKSE